MINVQLESSGDKSHLGIFKKLVQLKKNEVLRWGDYKSALIQDQVYAFRRSYLNDTYIVVLNFGKSNLIIDLKKYFPSLKSSLKAVITTLNSNIKDNAKLDSSKIRISAESGFVAYSSGERLAVSIVLMIFCIARVV